MKSLYWVNIHESIKKELKNQHKPLIFSLGLSIVEDVKITPIQYSESDSINLSWKQPADLGSNSVSDLTYDVKYCQISTTNCKEFGKITETSVAMRDFPRDRNQIYTYHITVYGKDGSKSKEKIDLIRFQKRGKMCFFLFLFFLIILILRKQINFNKRILYLLNIPKKIILKCRA